MSIGSGRVARIGPEAAGAGPGRLGGLADSRLPAPRPGREPARAAGRHAACEFTPLDWTASKRSGLHPIDWTACQALWTPSNWIGPRPIQTDGVPSTWPASGALGTEPDEPESCPGAWTCAGRAGRPPLLLLLFAAPAALAAPQVTFDPQGPTASGLTPGGEAVWLGVSRELDGWVTKVLHWQAITKDEDGDGVVALELGEALPPASVWAVVDLASGELAVAAPEGSPGAEVAFPPDALQPGVDGPQGVVPDRFVDARSQLSLLVARPGAGAWWERLGDGGEGDDDGEADGVVTAALDKLSALEGGGASPAHLAAGDVVVAIDPDCLELYATRLGPPAP